MIDTSTTGTGNALKPCPFCRNVPTPSVVEEMDDRRYVRMQIECCVTMSTGIGWSRYKNMSEAAIKSELLADLTKQWNDRDVVTESKLSWIDRDGCRHEWAHDAAIKCLGEFFEEWPGGLEEVDASMKSFQQRDGEFTAIIAEQQSRISILEAKLATSRETLVTLARVDKAIENTRINLLEAELIAAWVAFESILEEPESTLSDGKALKEIVRITRRVIAALDAARKAAI